MVDAHSRTGQLELGIVVLVLEGVVRAEEFDGHVAPLVEAPEYGLMPLTLVDMTAALRGDFPAEIVRQHARRAAAKIDGKIASGAKMALVAPRDEFFGPSRMYSTLRDESPVECRVFRTLQETEEWFDLPPGYGAQLEGVV